MTERERFEAWTAANWRLGARQSPWDVAWEAWQAALAAPAPAAEQHPGLGGIYGKCPRCGAALTDAHRCLLPLAPAAEPPQDVTDLITRLQGYGQRAPSPGGRGLALEAAAALAAMQAKIDRLMLEHCPDEMTPGQVKTWGEHQRPVAEPPQDVAGLIARLNSDNQSARWNAGPEAAAALSAMAKERDEARALLRTAHPFIEDDGDDGSRVYRAIGYYFASIDAARKRS